jgi:hypothetical protein
MDSEHPEDPARADEALLAACRLVQEEVIAPQELLARWAALEQGWRAHIGRHEQYAQARLLRHDPEAAHRQRSRHLDIADRFQLRAIDLELRSSCADVAAKIMLDQVIAHLSADVECRFVAPKRRRRAG